MSTIATLVGANVNADQQTYTTASFNPVAGDFLICYVQASGTVLQGTLTDSLGGSWTSIGTVNDGTNVISLWSQATPTDTTARTVTWDNSPTGATGARVAVLAARTSGYTIRQSKFGTGTAGTAPNPVFTSAPLTVNSCIGIVSNYTNPATLSPPAGWTEINDVGYANPTTGVWFGRINSGETDPDILWTSNSATNFQVAIVEINDASQANGGNSNYIDGYYGLLRG